jgi:hypothetical protein
MVGFNFNITGKQTEEKQVQKETMFAAMFPNSLCWPAYSDYDVLIIYILSQIGKLTA